jgi:hypothetical protein
MQDGEWQAKEKIQVMGHVISECDQYEGGHHFHRLLEQDYRHTCTDCLQNHNLLSLALVALP